VLQRASSEIEKPANTATFKLFVIDEAWIFLKNATIRDWILKAEKTWRKKNAAMLLATQSIVELAASDMLHIVNESCPTKIFLANPNIDRKLYADVFQLNDTQLELLESLVPKRELLLIQPRGTKKLVLEVDALGYWMATNNARDNLKKREYFARFGIAEGLRHLAEDHPFRPRAMAASSSLNR
jgi:type IV secretory pathway VirB4 component